MTLKPLEFEIKTGDKLEIILPRILQELIEIKQGDIVLLPIEALKTKENNKMETPQKTTEKGIDVRFTDTAENEILLFNNAMRDQVYEKLVREIKNISQNIEMRRPQKTMVGFYEKGYGLVWVAYRVAGKIRVHLRKKDYSDVEKTQENFVPIGWGGYPEFYVYSEKDIEYVINLVKHALGLRI